MTNETLFSSSTLPGRQDITRHSFVNGATLLTRPNLTSPAVAIRGYLPIGALSDPKDQLGLASYTAASLMLGTRRNGFEQLNDRVESIGASLAFNGGAASTTFSGQCLSEDLPTLLNLILEILDQPIFPEQQVKRIKAQTLTMLDIQAQSTSDQADLAFDRLFYGSHPFALPVEGTTETIQSISRTDLVEFHQGYYQPSGMVLAIVGGVEPNAAFDTVSKTIGGWQKQALNKQRELPTYLALSKSQREHKTLKGKSQTDLIIGTQAPISMSQDYQIASVGNNILGVFGMMGRIGESVREKSGLAYYAQSMISSGIGPVPWQVVAGVNPANLDRSIQLIYQELETFTSTLVSQKELEDSITQMIGRMPMSLESNMAVAQVLLSMERYHLDLDYLHTLPSILRGVTAEEILRVAQKYWKLDQLVITSSGSAL